MKYYIISYDLNKSDKDYTGVYEAIKKASNSVWLHCLDSTWIIQSNYNSCEEIYNLISNHLDINDECFVCELTNHWYAQLSTPKLDYAKKMLK